MAQKLLVQATFDPEAGVWFTESEDLPGLCIEAPTVELLMERLPGAILDLLEADGDAADAVPFELVARTSSVARPLAA